MPIKTTLLNVLKNYQTFNKNPLINEWIDQVNRFQFDIQQETCDEITRIIDLHQNKKNTSEDVVIFTVSNNLQNEQEAQNDRVFDEAVQDAETMRERNHNMKKFTTTIKVCDTYNTYEQRCDWETDLDVDSKGFQVLERSISASLECWAEDALNFLKNDLKQQPHQQQYQQQGFYQQPQQYVPQAQIQQVQQVPQQPTWEPATQAQLGLLQKRHIAYNPNISKQEASALLDNNFKASSNFKSYGNRNYNRGGY